MANNQLMREGKSKFGFTLVEIIVTLSIFLIVLAAVFSLQIMAVKTTNRTVSTRDLQAEMRLALDAIIKEVRNAPMVLSISDASVPNSFTISGGKLRFSTDGSSFTDKTNSIFMNSNDIQYSISKPGTKYVLSITMTGRNQLSQYQLNTNIVLNNYTGSTGGPWTSLYFSRPSIMDP